MRNFQLEKMMGSWKVVQYFSSTEETAEYKCMQGDLQITNAKEVSSESAATYRHITLRSVTSFFSYASETRS